MRFMRTEFMMPVRPSAFFLFGFQLVVTLSWPFTAWAQTSLPGTQPLTVEGDLAAKMVMAFTFS